MGSPEEWTAKLSAQVRALQADPRPESVHQLRVAAGRLSVRLELAGERALRADLAWLRQSAARVRDLDVLLARHGAEAWAAPLASERREAAASLAIALATPRCRGLLRALEALPALDGSALEPALARLRRRVARAAQRALGGATPDAGEDARLHRLRKRVRRLRYALEWLGRDSSEARALQDALGALHDAAVARERALASGDAARASCAALERELAEGYARLPALWEASPSLHAHGA